MKIKPITSGFDLRNNNVKFAIKFCQHNFGKNDNDFFNQLDFELIHEGKTENKELIMRVIIKMFEINQREFAR